MADDRWASQTPSLIALNAHKISHDGIMSKDNPTGQPAVPNRGAGWERWFWILWGIFGLFFLLAAVAHRFVPR
jgi:hypothetical protein